MEKDPIDKLKERLSYKELSEPENGIRVRTMQESREEWKRCIEEKFNELTLGTYIVFKDPKDGVAKTMSLISFDDNIMVLWDSVNKFPYAVPRGQQILKEKSEKPTN